MADSDYLGKRGGFWHYVRRVPKEVAELDGRGIVKLTTKIRVADDPRKIRARRIAAQLNADTEAYWRELRAGQSAEAGARYQAARQKARAMGFDYAPAGQLADHDLGQILARIEAALGAARAPERDQAVAAALGGQGRPVFQLSGLLEPYEEIMKPSLKAMAPDQQRKWRNPKKRAIANLIQVIGDKTLDQITRSDALDFRAWWVDRVMVEDLEIGTANKDIGHLNKMLRTLDRQHRIGLEPVFAQLRIEGEETRSRAAFDVAFLRDQILGEGAFRDLNAEAQGVIYLMAETGLRVSEACNLDETTIRLDDEVPHVQVRADGRKLKTAQSERDIPLVGAALVSMKAHPGGFPRYRHKADSLSALVNKALELRGLRPTKRHTLYSLRHTFEDRLSEARAPEKIAAALMGHKFYRPKYGTGPTLKQKLEVLERMAVPSPANTSGQSATGKSYHPRAAGGGSFYTGS